VSKFLVPTSPGATPPLPPEPASLSASETTVPAS
jgi:hypothetical protein